jgi:hypothetical protein
MGPERTMRTQIIRANPRRKIQAGGREYERSRGKRTHMFAGSRGGVAPFIRWEFRQEGIAVKAKKVAATSTPTTVVANDPDDRKGALKSIGGSQSDHWNNTLANQVAQALWMKNSDAETRDKQLSATVAALVGIAPKDELEGMMAAQLIAAHNAAMECYRRAMIGEQTFEGRRENLSQANKLSRTYAALVEALNRHRSKGQQKVTVEHVHVHAGGQAVVGVVGRPGGGDRSKSEEQPHAKQIAHASEPAMPSPDSDWHAVPVARHDERPLPDARRQITRRAEEK